MNEEIRPRSCREEASFAQQKMTVISQIGITERQFDDAYLLPFELLIALNPAIYPEIEGTDLRVIVTRGLPRFPSLRIAYSFDDELIHLWYVDVSDTSNGHDSD